MARYGKITQEGALAEMRRFIAAYPDSPPEITAIAMMRRIDAWEEHTAILNALAEVIAEQAKTLE